MFAITIKDINKYIKKQIQPEPDLKEVLLVEFQEFADVFSKEVSDTLPEHREEYDHKIELEAGAELPRTQPLRRMSPDELKVIKKYIEEHLEKGFIEPSTASFASLILLVRKP
ncbi:hypothetical protein EPUS_07714 [Endocarpon pusillum Z07020]|uniref:Uncharacterized protein n=1 Tax=Endocarpon pusillum (strain Z07020 / HMAS-L-300199) TaxID=1263415 RepID=U1HVV6_ENDPU|nr:uncharacterized protein EPUS_07714 [Endocarpon pusillum Z07020]ERF73509.1 hypothetical protein EPUS_07714 [Endocarpon pusillum Z07020]